MNEMHPALYYAILLTVAILGWFAKALFSKKDDTVTQRHIAQMEEHCKASDRFADKQTSLLAEMASMLAKIEIHTELTAKGMLENKRINGDLADAISKLSISVNNLLNKQ